MTLDTDRLIAQFLDEFPQYLARDICYTPAREALLSAPAYTTFLFWCGLYRHVPPRQVVTALSNAMHVMQMHATHAGGER